MNRNQMLAMSSLTPMLFDAEAPAGGGGGAGGGTATAAAPAAPAAASTTAAPAASGGAADSGKGAAAGLFGGLSRHAQTAKPEEKKPEPSAAKPEGGAVAEPAKGEAAVTAPNPDALTRPVMGRFKTIPEVEDAMRRSQDEGIRLFQENKTLKESHQKELADREAQLAAAKAEIEDIRKNGVFKELSKEELETLRKENPSGYTDYVLEMKARQDQARSEKARAEAEVRQRNETQAKVADHIRQTDVRLRADKANFPGYEDQISVMDQIISKTIPEGAKHSPLTGHPWTPEILYFAAKGIAAVQAEKAGQSAKSQAEAKAAADSATKAAAAAGPAGDGKTPALGKTDDGKAYKQSVLAAGPKQVFGKRP